MDSITSSSLVEKPEELHLDDGDIKVVIDQSWTTG
jgi:hypothetical protein